MSDVTPPTSDADVVDRVLGVIDHALDLVHDRVLRPIILAGRFVAYIFVFALVAIVLLSVVIIALVRVLNIYAFAGHEWLSYATIGVITLIVGLLIWRRRRPVSLRK